MLIQLLLNGLIAASLYTVAGAGFSITFRIFGFFNFSYGLMCALGAYFTFAFHTWARMPLIPAIGTALLATVGIGLFLDFSIFARLRERNGTALVLMLASIGVYVVGQNALSMVFGDGVCSIRPYRVPAGAEIWGGRITSVQMGIVISAILVFSCLSAWLSRTRIGKQIRAVSSNRELASIVGISTDRIMKTVVAVGAAIGGFSGVLSALDRNMVPTMGMSVFLTAVIVMIIGGQESLGGLALAGLLVGITQNLTILWIGAAWQEAVVFFVLIVFLVLRPQGFFGSPLRKALV